MPKLISTTGSYWYGRIPVAISNFFCKFIRSFVHWNCRSKWQSSLVMTSQLTFDFTAPSKLSAKTCAIMWLQRLFPLPILPWHIGLVLRFISIYDTWKIWNYYWGTGYIPAFTVWKYLVGRIYQRRDVKLKSVKISVMGPFNLNIITSASCTSLLHWSAHHNFINLHITTSLTCTSFLQICKWKTCSSSYIVIGL